MKEVETRIHQLRHLGGKWDNFSLKTPVSPDWGISKKKFTKLLKRS